MGLLVLLLGGLQYRLWFAPGSLAEQHRLELQLQEQTEINRQLRERNSIIEREVLELQSGTKGVEQRAREQLGLVPADRNAEHGVRVAFEGVGIMVSHAIRDQPYPHGLIIRAGEEFGAVRVDREAHDVALVTPQHHNVR